MKKNFVLAFTSLLATAAFAEPYVTNVLVRQRRPWSEKVDIDFTVGGERADVSFFATWEGQDAPVELLPAAGLTGRACGILGDEGHVTWDPAEAGYSLPLRNFRVTTAVSAVSGRTWLVVDLKDGSHEFLSAPPADGFGDDVYKTEKMVFRRIPAATFTMGYSSTQITACKRANGNSSLGNNWNLHMVTLTDDYYMAIYRVTAAQWEWINSRKQTSTGDAAKSTKVGTDWNKKWADLSYDSYRGSKAAGIDWPDTKYAVASTSFFGKFRNLTGNRFRLDFPTDAQWENACRCGTTTLWSHGGETSITAAGISNMVEQVCNTKANSVAGEKMANTYGLYDMVGLALEWCLDRWVAQLGTGPVVNPVGGTDDIAWRVVKGGGKDAKPDTKPGFAVPAYRVSSDPTVGRNSSYGYNVARPCIHLNSLFK